MDNYEWAEKLAKEGRRRTFSDYDEKFWRAVQRKYSDDYATYLTQLYNLYSFDVRNPERVRIKNDLSLVKSIVKEIGVVLSTRADKKEILKSSNVLFNSMTAMDNELRQLQADGGVSVELSQKIKRAEELSGLQVKELQRSSAIIQGRAAKMKYTVSPTPGVASFPATARLGLDIAKGALSGALGPLGGIAGVVSRDIYGMLERRRERRRGATIESLLTSGEHTPEGFERMQAYLGGGGIEERRARFRGERGFPTGPSLEFGGTDLGKRMVGRDPFLQALNVFFSRDAFRCRWTNEIYEAVTREKREEGLRGRVPHGAMSMAGLMGIPATIDHALSAIKNVLPLIQKAMPILGSALAIAGSAFVGWKVGRWIGEHVKIRGKTIDELLTAGFQEKVLGGSVEDRLKKASKEAQRPIMKRALELQAQGVGGKESVMRAQAELGTGASIIIGGEKLPMKIEPAAIEKSNINVVTDKGHPSLERRVPIKSELSEAPATVKQSVPTTKELVAEGVVLHKVVTPQVEYEKTKGIPIDTSSRKAIEANEEGLDKVASILNETNEEIKKSGKRQNVGQSSGADAYNTRDPMLANANVGSLTVYA